MPDHFPGWIAKHLFHRGIYKDDKASFVDRDDRVRSRFSQSAKPIFTFAQSFFLLLAFDELSDVTADSREHRQHFIVALADLVTEKLAHPNHFAAQENREPESAFQTHPRSRSQTRKVRILLEFGNPTGLATLPDPSRQADARFKDCLSAQDLELTGSNL